MKPRGRSCNTLTENYKLLFAIFPLLLVFSESYYISHAAGVLRRVGLSRNPLCMVMNWPACWIIDWSSHVTMAAVSRCSWMSSSVQEQNQSVSAERGKQKSLSRAGICRLLFLFDSPSNSVEEENAGTAEQKPSLLCTRHLRTLFEITPPRQYGGISV